MQFEDLIKLEVPSEDSTDIEEKMILYTEIKKRKPKVVVEIGTHRGLTTLYMAHALFENGEGHLHTCDPNEEWNQKGNFRKFPDLEKYITFYLMKGIDLPKEIINIDFLFIDGFHEKHFVLEELKEFIPRLSKKAVVYFHDTNGSNEYCDVPGAIDEFGLKVEYIKTKNGMAIYDKNISCDPVDKTPGVRSNERKSSKTDV